MASVFQIQLYKLFFYYFLVSVLIQYSNYFFVFLTIHAFTTILFYAHAN